MPLPRSLLTLSVMAAVLTACGSSSEPTFDERRDGFFVQRDNFLDTTQPVQNFSDLPTSGTATFNGAVGVTLTDVDRTSIIGDLALEVAYSDPSGTVSGRADNFTTDFGEDFSGGLDITNGELGDSGIATGVGFNGDLTGTLVGPQTGTVVVDADMSGTFGTPLTGGGDVVGAVGLVTGSVDIGGNTVEIGDGAFIVTE
ncbi:hypothetical protein [Pseudooctadecabacter sp.]|uniref:hypothetical protein n=1 Tax=Pseudooctadecabacter sp. TaxID=1966338 RepID=UPI0025CDB4E1|nr:hypothetical protein [Pseudooctadecabacter sp.]